MAEEGALMGVIRVHKSEHYLVQLNRRTLEDERLSFRARGLWAYLMTKPDDWRINYRHLVKIGPDKQHAVLSALRELETCGYLLRRPIQDKTGKWGWEQVLYDRPSRHRALISRARKTHALSKAKALSTKEEVVRDACENCGSVADLCWCGVSA